MSIGTPFHGRLAALNRNHQWSDWSGYLAAAVYADFHDIEYSAVRNAVGVFDVSPLYKYLVTGPDAVRLIDRIVTRDATRLAVGQVLYTPWCDERGKVVDDGTITRLGETTFRWTAAHPVWRWITMNAGALAAGVPEFR
jgi:aminomethyltransferase